jgi:hypothetical protein
MTKDYAKMEKSNLEQGIITGLKHIYQDLKGQ